MSTRSSSEHVRYPGPRDDRSVADGLHYRADLFKGTAESYDRYRPPYPAALLADLRARVPLLGTSRLLDLACGTGQVAFALASDVAEVWAVDQEPELVEFGRAKAHDLGVTNIRWIAAAAEEVELEGAFDLVAIGNAFHRLDRDVVATRVTDRLFERGCVALLWGDSPWRVDRPWQHVLHETLERWRDTLDARDRVPRGWEAVMANDPHEQVLRRAGLTYEGRFEFTSTQQWTVDTILGFVASTSFLNHGVLAEHVDEFERELRGHLLSCSPDDVFEQDASFAYELARASEDRG